MFQSHLVSREFGVGYIHPIYMFKFQLPIVVHDILLKKEKHTERESKSLICLNRELLGSLHEPLTDRILLPIEQKRKRTNFKVSTAQIDEFSRESRLLSFCGLVSMRKSHVSHCVSI